MFFFVTSFVLVALVLWYVFSIYVHIWLLFILVLFIVKIRYMFRPNWPPSDTQVGLTI
jgi:hypothetical protein